MKFDDLPDNTICFLISLTDDGEGIAVSSALDVDEGLDEEKSDFLVDLMNGMNMKLNLGAEELVMQGQLARHLKELTDGSLEPEIVFEPDEELLEALEERKIIPFNKDKMN